MEVMELDFIGNWLSSEGIGRGYAGVWGNGSAEGVSRFRDPH
jgi:hypothetical protein